MKIFIMAASLRRESLNKILAQEAARVVEAAGFRADLADFGEFTMPLYNADLEVNDGPEGCLALAERIAGSDAVIISTPEYNYSIPGTLKNAIDWLSRLKSNPFAGGKPTFLLSTSPGSVGGARGLWQTRIPLEGIGAYVHPDMFYVPNGGQAIQPGGIGDEELRGQFARSLHGFFDAAKALKHRRSGA